MQIRHLASEDLTALGLVLEVVRDRGHTTRPEITKLSGLGRNVVAARVAQLLDSGLVEDGETGSSTGGRAPRGLRFRARAGSILAAEIGATSINVAVTDLSGQVLADHEQPMDVASGPEVVLRRVRDVFDQLLAELPRDTEVWGVGLGVPGPVEFATGRPISPPIMPGWDGYPVRDVLGEHYEAPVWVDNDVNVMALGELRVGAARRSRNFVYVKVGTGIGAGLVSRGSLHRGEQGAAGDIGHVHVAAATGIVCRCGKVGCLEALAGGAALARQATEAVRAGSSGVLAARLAEAGVLEAVDVGHAAAAGDPVAVELLTASGHLVGETLAAIVNFFNPALIILGGGVVASGDLYVAAVREVVYRQSLPLATRDLRIIRSGLRDRAGVIGAALMVADELFALSRLEAWLSDGTPAGRPELADLSAPGSG